MRRSPRLPSFEPLRKLARTRDSECIDTPAERLRLSLAVRGWAPPTELLIDDPDGPLTLSTVAPDVLTSPETQPGRWYLTTDVRVRSLVGSSFAQILAELTQRKLSSDKEDAVFQAFCFAFGLDKTVSVATPEDLLRSLANIVSWLDPAGEHLQSLFDKLTAHLESQERRADLERITKSELVGREREIAVLKDFARAGPVIGDYIYIYGAGGSGKTSLLRRFAFDLERGKSKARVIEIDLDRIEVDPGEPATLDLELARQLLVLRPELAPQLRDVSRSVLRARSSQADDTVRRRTKGQASDPIESESRLVDRAELESIVEESRLHEIASEPGTILVVDTIEVAAARGADVLTSLGAWLSRLVNRGTRLILAGRDKPDTETSRFLLRQMPPRALYIHLEALDEGFAKEVLRSYGLSDSEFLDGVVSTLPRNPLLLRTAAEIYRDESKRAAAQQWLDDGKVDPAVAEAYLVHRIVAHLPDRTARPYLLAALCLPWLDRTLITEVVAPAVDDGRVPSKAQAGEIYDAISSAEWLASPDTELKRLEWSTELREIIMKVMPAAPSAQRYAQKVRLLALVAHGRRNQAKDRAMLAYHLLRHSNDLERVRELLRDRPTVLEFYRYAQDLPKNLTESILGPTAPWRDEMLADVAPIARRSSKAEWREYLEGGLRKIGTGTKLVTSGNALQSLSIYRERPTRERGTPPNFVIEALCDEALWNTDRSDPAFVETEAVIEELHRDYRKKGLVDFERLRLIARLELLRGETSVLKPERLLDMALHLTNGAPDTGLRSILRIADAMSGQRILRMIPPPKSAASFQTTPRNLIPDADGWLPIDVPSIRVDAIVKFDPLWIDTFEQMLERSTIRPVRLPVPNLVPMLARLKRSRFSTVAELLRVLRVNVRMTIPDMSPQSAQMMLQGSFPELQKPLVSAVRDLALRDHQLASSLITRTRDAFPACPRDFRDIEGLLERNDAAWLPAFLSYVDRSGLLKTFVTAPELRGHPASQAARSWIEALLPKLSRL